MSMSAMQSRPLIKRAVLCQSQPSDRSSIQPAASPVVQQPTRRNTLKLLVTSPVVLSTIAATSSTPAQAIDAPPSTVTEQPPVAAAPKWKLFIERDFLLRYPPTYFAVDNSNPTPSARPKDNPVKAEIRSADNNQRISVIVKQASTLKRTLTTLTDVTQIGNNIEVAALVLPPGTNILASTTIAIPQPVRDTGTPLGKIERDPINMYRYEVALPNGDYADLSVGVRLGYIYVMAASSVGEAWEEAAPTLRQVADSFKLLSK